MFRLNKSSSGVLMCSTHVTPSTHVDTVVHRNHVVCEHTCKPSGIPNAHRQIVTSQGS